MQTDWTHQLQASLLNWLPADRIEQLAGQHPTPIQVIDLQRVVNNYHTLKRVLPMVDHHYAIKAMPSAEVIVALHQQDAGFDIASNGEIDLVRRFNIDPKTLVHTHPIKRASDISYALDYGIDHFVFDSPYELDVLEPFKDQVKLLLRLSFRTQRAQIDLSSKFGAPADQGLDIIKTAAERGFQIVGISFHAGSQLYTPDPMVSAIDACRELYNLAAQQGIKLTMLDIGGGFPAAYNEPILTKEAFCAPIAKALADFPTERIISEAGRGIIAEAAISISRVMGYSDRDNQRWYYLDDGIYGSYSGILFEHGDYPIWSLKQLRDPGLPLTPVTLAGPTCDSVDVIARNLPLPDLERGDIIVSPSMGAYSWATSTEFNSFPVPKLVFINQ